MKICGIWVNVPALRFTSCENLASHLNELKLPVKWDSNNNVCLKYYGAVASFK